MVASPTDALPYGYKSAGGMGVGVGVSADGVAVALGDAPFDRLAVGELADEADDEDVCVGDAVELTEAVRDGVAVSEVIAGVTAHDIV